MAQCIDIVMPMYNLMEYKDNYSKKSGILWRYCRDVPAVDDDDVLLLILLKLILLLIRLILN